MPNIVILGLPGVGKTEYTKELKTKNPKFSFYHTDDYIKHGYEQSLYVLMDDLANDPNPNKIIEGVQAYRLLRKGLENKSFYADEVIICQCPDEVRKKRYMQREGKELKESFDKALTKVWNDYLALLEQEETKPEISIKNT